MMNRGLKRDYLWNTVGVLAQNAISPLLLVIITRVNGLNDSGLFSFAFSVAIIFWAVGMWGGRTYQVSDVKQEFSQQSYVIVRLLLALFMLFGAAIFSFINHYDVTKSSVIIALVLFKAMESIADPIYGVMQTHDKLFVAGKSLTYKAAAGFLVFIALDIITKSLFLSSLGVVVVNLLIILFYDLPNAHKLEDIRLHKKYIKPYIRDAVRIMKRCWPVFLISFLSAFSLNIPRYFVDIYHGEEIGYFGILAMPITLVVLVMSFILQPKIMQLTHLFEKRHFVALETAVTKIIKVTVLIGGMILLGTYVAGAEALQLVFGIQFTQYKTPLIIIVGGAIASALVAIFINVFIIIRYFKAQFYILLFTNVLLAVASIYIVQFYGLLGGVSLFTATNVIQMVLFIIIFRMYLVRLRHA